MRLVVPDITDCLRSTIGKNEKSILDGTTRGSSMKGERKTGGLKRKDEVEDQGIEAERWNFDHINEFSCCNNFSDFFKSSMLKPFAILRASQSLYDDVTLGPYGTYDAQTYYFHDPSPVSFATAHNSASDTDTIVLTECSGG
jgi:hypothetical protein